MKDYNLNKYTQSSEISLFHSVCRVLDEAEDPSVPLFERLKFIGKFSMELNELFSYRLGRLFGTRSPNKGYADETMNFDPADQIYAIYSELPDLFSRRDRIFHEVTKRLRMSGVTHLRMRDTEGELRSYIHNMFYGKLMHEIETRSAAKLQEFPYLQNGRKYVAARAVLGTRTKYIFASIPHPDEVIFAHVNGIEYLLMEDVMLGHVSRIASPYKVEEAVVLSVIKNADSDADTLRDDDDSLYDPDNISSTELDNVKRGIIIRKKNLAPVRLDLSGEISDRFLTFLLKGLRLGSSQVFISRSGLDFGYLRELERALPYDLRSRICYGDHVPAVRLSGVRSVIEQIKRKDVLLSYPYDSPDPFFRMLTEAASDQRVSEIRITLRRLADKPRIVDILKAAAANGKRVRVVFELRARFDEQQNVERASELENAGCEVCFGPDSCRVHANICQILMRDDKGIYGMMDRNIDGSPKTRFLTQIGTGNYNEDYTGHFTGFSLMTYDQAIGKDISDYFEDIVSDNETESYRFILAAPSQLKTRLLSLIEREKEKGQNGRIFIKANEVSDPEIISRLSEASCAGVKIRIVTGDVCSLLPGVPGCTDNIKVVNITGRFIEHSRVYVFGSRDDEIMYISSADLIPASMAGQFEIACPLFDRDVRNRIKHILYLNFKDNIKGRLMDSRGLYIRNGSSNVNIDSQRTIASEAEEVQNR